MIAESASAVAGLAAARMPRYNSTAAAFPINRFLQRGATHRQLIPAIRRRRARGRLFQRSLTAEAEPNLPRRWPQR